MPMPVICVDLASDMQKEQDALTVYCKNCSLNKIKTQTVIRP